MVAGDMWYIARTLRTGVPKIPDVFFFENKHAPTQHFYTDCHHMQWCLELDENERWLVQHLNAAEELCTKTESVTAIQHGFRQQFQRCNAPSHSNLLLRASRSISERE